MRFTRALVPLALAGALLAGCGGDSDGTSGGTPTSAAPTANGVANAEPKAIVEKAVAALGSAKSYSMKGEIAGEGEKVGIDLKIAGVDVMGTISLGETKIEMLRVGGDAYIRPDEAFWKTIAGDAASTVTAAVGTKWAKVGGSVPQFQTFFEITDAAKLLKPEGTFTKGDTKTINGVEAIGVVQSGTDGGTLYVATTGEPYPLQLVSATAGESQLTFGDFGATFDGIKAPDAAEVVDVSKLIGG